MPWGRGSAGSGSQLDLRSPAPVVYGGCVPSGARVGLAPVSGVAAGALVVVEVGAGGDGVVEACGVAASSSGGQGVDDAVFGVERVVGVFLADLVGGQGDGHGGGGDQGLYLPDAEGGAQAGAGVVPRLAGRVQARDGVLDGAVEVGDGLRAGQVGGQFRGAGVGDVPSGFGQGGVFDVVLGDGAVLVVGLPGGGLGGEPFLGGGSVGFAAGVQAAGGQFGSGGVGVARGG